MTSTPETQPRAATAVLQLLRGVFHLVAVATLTVWGFAWWSFPWPAAIVGVGILLLCVLIWALFLSPKPVLRTDRFGQALIELLLIAGAVAAMFSLGVFWAIPVAFGIAAAIVGYLASARQP